MPKLPTPNAETQVTDPLHTCPSLCVAGLLLNHLHREAKTQQASLGSSFSPLLNYID